MSVLRLCSLSLQGRRKHPWRDAGEQQIRFVSSYNWTRHGRVLHEMRMDFGQGTRVQVKVTQELRPNRYETARVPVWPYFLSQ